MEGVCDAIVSRMLENLIPIIVPIIPAIFLLIMIKLRSPVGMFIMSGVLFLANFKGYAVLRIMQHIPQEQIEKNIVYLGLVTVITVGSIILCIFGVVKGSMLYKLKEGKDNDMEE